MPAFTIIFAASIVIWALRTFDLQLNIAATDADSLLAHIGRLIAPVFWPLGFADWRASTSLIAGFMAKEAVISTLTVLAGDGQLGAVFTAASAISFLVFTLLYTPCVAAVAAIRRELNSSARTLGIVVMQCGIAWVCAALVYQLIRLFA